MDILYALGEQTIIDLQCQIPFAPGTYSQVNPTFPLCERHLFTEESCLS